MDQVDGLLTGQAGRAEYTAASKIKGKVGGPGTAAKMDGLRAGCTILPQLQGAENVKLNNWAFSQDISVLRTKVQ
jgi:hypothetical protein